MGCLFVCLFVFLWTGVKVASISMCKAVSSRCLSFLFLSFPRANKAGLRDSRSEKAKVEPARDRSVDASSPIAVWINALCIEK